MTQIAQLPLRGAGGEPVDFARTIISHGVAELPPNRVDVAGRTLETTLPVPRGARTLRITEHNGKLRIEGSADQKLTQTVAHMFRLDEDLSGGTATRDPRAEPACARRPLPRPPRRAGW